MVKSDCSLWSMANFRLLMDITVLSKLEKDLSYKKNYIISSAENKNISQISKSMFLCTVNMLCNYIMMQG